MSDTKICTGCKCEHPLDYFPWQWRAKKPGKRRSRCKACTTEYSSQYYLRNKAHCDSRDKKKRQQNPKKKQAAVERKRQWRKDNPERSKIENKRGYQNRVSIRKYIMNKYEGTPCMDCENVFPWCVMDFDHRPEETKSFVISRRGPWLVNPERIAEVEKEIAKCDLVCANCHRVRTRDRHAAK
jgi:hypothetical protein